MGLGSRVRARARVRVRVSVTVRDRVRVRLGAMVASLATPAVAPATVPAQCVPG